MRDRIIFVRLTEDEKKQNYIYRCTCILGRENANKQLPIWTKSKNKTLINVWSELATCYEQIDINETIKKLSESKSITA